MSGYRPRRRRRPAISMSRACLSGGQGLAHGGPEERLDPLAEAVEDVRIGVEVRLGVALEEVEDDRQGLPRGDAGQGVEGGQADDRLVVEEPDQMDGLLRAREVDKEADVLEPRRQPGGPELAEAAAADRPLEDDLERLEGLPDQGLAVGDEEPLKDPGPGPVLPGEFQRPPGKGRAPSAPRGAPAPSPRRGGGPSAPATRRAGAGRG